MSDWRTRLYKPGLLLLALGLLVGSASIQTRLNADRKTLGLTRRPDLSANAPPVLVLTTQVLGSFRGLIANALWVRAMELQDDGKYFEMVQLADWITKLQPHFTTVWVVQAWNMAYNISIKFTEPRDRWHWVLRGIELLRDDGLRYNPQETLIYRELAWFFQHKMGANLDDAHLYFKGAWARLMMEVAGPGPSAYRELLDPKTPEAYARLERLTKELKLDPRQMLAVDEAYGPLDWRLPEAHAIYWAYQGRASGRKEEQITLRRVVFQSLQLSFMRGRLIENQFEKNFQFGPNLDIVKRANEAYEQMMEEDEVIRNSSGHKNFLKTAVYYFYSFNRLEEAAYWFAYLKKKYPDSVTPDITYDEWAAERVQEEVGDTSVDRTTSVLEGLFSTSYFNLAIGQDAAAVGHALLAERVWRRYQSRMSGEDQQKRVGLPPLEDLKQRALQQVLDPERGFSPELAAQLRFKLGLPMPTNNPPASPATNAPVPPAGTR